MHPARELAELYRRFGKIQRFVEPIVIGNENLVRADDDGIGMAYRDGARFGLRQFHGADACVPARSAALLLYRGFVDGRGDRCKSDPGGAQHFRSRRTCRSQN